MTFRFGAWASGQNLIILPTLPPETVDSAGFFAAEVSTVQGGLVFHASVPYPPLPSLGT
jgi:hypothetical protein